MRNKITLLLALLCVSVMSWATQICDVALHHFDDDNANSRILVSLQPTGNANEYVLTIRPNTAEGNTYQVDYLYAIIGNGGTTSPYPIVAGADEGGGYDELSATFTYTGGVDNMMIQWSRPGWTGRSQNTLTSIDISSLTACSSKPSPELSLNATSKTLEIDAAAETFQIVPTKVDGSGDISYFSNAEGVATVSSTGLVTAVGNGTATITVSVAENGSYAAESKTLTVTVIDWPNIGWLANSDNSYKLHISPDISDSYGGKRIDGGTNLWVGCPSDLFGACSIDFTHSGAAAMFSLSNFTKTRNQFTLVCQGTTYTFMVYRKFDGVNLAKGKPSSSGHAGLPNFEANDGNKGSRWGSEGAKHYAEAGDVAEDWWYVDLGAVYSVETIKILFQTACPTDFDILTSPNGDSWVVRGTYGTPAHSGDATTDDYYNEYTLSPAQNARYVKIFARDGYNHLQWGFSMWEFEVYGQPAENVDVNAPVLASASLYGDPTASEVQISVSATDAEGAVTTYRVKDISNGIDRNCTVAAGIITISGLLEGTNYSFTVTALDAMGNQSNAIVVAASTAADPTFPQIAAPTPDGTGKEVLAIYSDVVAFANILAHPFDKDGWEGAHVLREKDFSGNKCLIYDMSSTKYTTWGMYDNGGNAIIATSGYSDPDNAEHKGVDASGMEKLHIDIWSLQACNSINLQINDQGRGALRLSHSGEGWQSFDIDLSEFVEDGNADKRTNNVRWFKFLDFSTVTGKIAIDNVYFWKPESGSKTVAVSVNNGSMGTASATVGDDPAPATVATDTEVTFTATPSSAAYDFAYWQIGETKVYENPYTVAITANTNAVAYFEAHRTTYCGTEITDPTWSTSLYVTISNPSANTYKILVEGSSSYKIASAYNNFNFALTHVNGEAGTTTFPAASWTVDDSGYGSAYITFTATDFREVTYDNAGSRYVVFNKQGGGTMEFRAFPDANLIKWDATCTDTQAPVLSAPTATALGSSSARLSLYAEDDMSAILTYHVNYKATSDPGAGTNVDVVGASGETTYRVISGLTTGAEYTFTVTVSDAATPTPNTSAAQSCTATPTMPLAPVPTHPANLVRSIYSDTYTSVITSNYGKNSYSGISYEEKEIGGNKFILYDYSTPKEIVWGADNQNADAILAAAEYTDGEHLGLDVRNMQYIHFDVYSTVITTTPRLYVQNTTFAYSVDDSGWQGIDIDISGLDASVAQSVTMLKFNDFVVASSELGIDNVYFWTNGYAPATPDGGWSSFSSSMNLNVPGGVTAYKADYQSNETEDILLLTELTSGVIPANMGVILKGTPGATIKGFTVTEDASAISDAVSELSGNDLLPSVTNTPLSDNTKNYYTLRYSDAVGTIFQCYTGPYIPAGKAYFTLNKPSGPNPAPARPVRIVLRDNSTTNIENTGAEAVKATKFLENGQLLIRRGEAVYTIEGTRVR